MKLAFTKLEGAGNDFVVLDATTHPLALNAAQLQHLADRHFGIGCDQILLVEPATRPDADFFYRIYNADGTESGQCGNGARCLAQFIHNQGLSQAQTLRLQTRDGLLVATQMASGQWQINMGLPRLEPQDIPLEQPQRQASYTLTHPDGHQVELGAVSMGNPHAVIRVSDARTAAVESLGPWLERHPLFPARVNVGFMEIISPEHIRLRVYERGAGETLACGSGACAAVVVGRLRGWLAESVQVSVRGGELAVSWLGEGAPVNLSGSAHIVFEGSIAL